MKQKEEIKKDNELILQRFNRIEAGLNAARDISTFFETLFEGIEDEFKIPFVWMTLIDREDTRPLIAAVEAAEGVKNRFRILSRDAFEALLPDLSRPVLVNHDLRPYYRLLPVTRKYFIKSLAITPIGCDGRVVGVWNNGDPSADRFVPDMETDLLMAFGRTLSGRLAELMRVAGGSAAKQGESS